MGSTFLWGPQNWWLVLCLMTCGFANLREFFKQGVFFFFPVLSLTQGNSPTFQLSLWILTLSSEVL